MTHPSTRTVGAAFDRRDLLKRALIGGGVVTAALAAPGFTGIARAAEGKTLALDVDTNGFADFQGPAATEGNGSFYVSGDISAGGSGGPSIGTFHCWGYIAESGVGVVNQEFDIDGRGKIIIAGVESDALRAVTGGTGDFANARGQGRPDISGFDEGLFSVVFRLTGASGPPIR